MIRLDTLIVWLAVGSLAAICLFISAFLAWYVWRRRKNVSAVPGREASQSWRTQISTLAPVLVFALAFVPLAWFVYLPNANPAVDVTITVTGKMWFWTYKYADQGNFSFNAPMLAAASAAPPGRYDHIVVPVGKTIRIVSVANKVIYSWTIPAIGAEIEALPGRSNQSWFKAEQEGRYFGECLELCGLPHAFKPIQVEVVSAERFEQWVAGARQRLSATATAPPAAAAR
jgi:cytochrome c oxidase subunit 2